MERTLITWAASAALLGPALGLAGPPPPTSPQEPSPPANGREAIAARVTALTDAGILIDRGAPDGLRVGDRVVFTLRGGQERYGLVQEFEGRGAVVRPINPSFRPAPGTRASIEVPVARFEEPAPPAPAERRAQGAPAADGSPAGSSSAGGPRDGPSEGPAKGTDAEAPDAPTGSRVPDSIWKNLDEDWTEDMPLLAEVSAVRPADRTSSLTGRSYLSWDRIVDSEDGRGDSFLRAGGGVYGDNLFGRGGMLHVDGEFNGRKTWLPDGDDDGEADFRLDRLSYTLGGTRHDWDRWQFGRFLQYGMPEFGVLDGAEWSTRRGNGDSYGGSIGFLPEPDQDQESLEDFQLSGWYRWVADENERLSFTGGYQKTWHNGTRDRDLVIAKAEWLPRSDWSLFATAWLDIYGVGESVKSNGPELTYMTVDARRSLGERAGIELDYRHQEYPELLRSEYPVVGLESLDQARVDRFSGTLFRWVKGGPGIEGSTRLYGRGGLWFDEEDKGGDAELGVDFHDVLAAGDRIDVAGFTTRSKFSDLLGARLRYGRYAGTQGWSVLYEIRQNDIVNFDVVNDDLVQHRIRGSYDYFNAGGWSASVTAEFRLQDLEDQLFLGFFLQRSF